MPDERIPLVSRWFAATCIVVFAASVAAVLFARGVGGGLSFGPRLAAALSITAYGAVAFAGFRRASLEDRLSWWVAVVAAHAALGMLVAWFFGVIGALGLGAAMEQAFGGFGPAALVSLVAAPLAALPFRPAVPVGRVPRVTQRWITASHPGPRPDAMLASVDPPARWSPATRPTVTPAPHPSSDRATGREVAARAHGPVLRITFERIADQLPPDMLALPPARLAATLLAPGEMLVPVGLVAPRLHEGAIDVPATVLEDQLPRGAVLASSPDARARWSALRLALPMDEVVAQLRADPSPPATPHAGAPAHTAPPDERAEPMPQDAARPRRQLRADEIATVVDHLAPAGRFETHSREVGRIGHLLLCVRRLAPETLECAASTLFDALPFPGGGPVVVTLITDRATVALAVGEDAAIAAGAGQPPAPMALMELLAGRAASAIGIGRWARREPPGGEPPGLETSSLGEVPSALDRALGGVDLGRPVAVSVRGAAHRTEVRWVDGRAVVAAAATRPGVARRQPARAVSALDAAVGVIDEPPPAPRARRDTEEP